MLRIVFAQLKLYICIRSEYLFNVNDVMINILNIIYSRQQLCLRLLDYCRYQGNDILAKVTLRRSCDLFSMASFSCQCTCLLTSSVLEFHICNLKTVLQKTCFFYKIKCITTQLSTSIFIFKDVKGYSGTYWKQTGMCGRISIFDVLF